MGVVVIKKCWNKKALFCVVTISFILLCTKLVPNNMDWLKYGMHMTRMERVKESNVFNNDPSFGSDTNKNGTDHPLITLFTTWTKQHNRTQIYQNTIQIWNLLYPQVQPIVFTNEPEIKSQIKDTFWKCLPISGAFQGVPYLKNMYQDAKAKYHSPLYGYANGDMLFTSSFVDTLKAVLEFKTQFPKSNMLVVGRKTNIWISDLRNVSSFKSIEDIAERKGTLFRPDSVDFFITSPDFPWNSTPPIIIARARYDNWVIMHAHSIGSITIDVSKTVLGVHQTNINANYRKGQFENYNIQLLYKTYKIKNFGSGLTTNSKYFTEYNASGNIVVRKNNLNIRK